MFRLLSWVMDEEEEPKCRFCDQPIEPSEDTNVCEECRWKLEEALNGRR